MQLQVMRTAQPANLKRLIIIVVMHLGFIAANLARSPLYFPAPQIHAGDGPGDVLEPREAD